MLGPGLRIPKDVQGELKRYLLVWAAVIEQRDRRAEGLEVEEANRVFELVEKGSERGAVYVWLAGEQSRALDGLVVGQGDLGGDLVEALDAPLEEVEGFGCAPVKCEDAGLRQGGPAVVMQRAGVRVIAVRADLGIGCDFAAMTRCIASSWSPTSRLRPEAGRVTSSRVKNLRGSIAPCRTNSLLMWARKHLRTLMPAPARTNAWNAMSGTWTSSLREVVDLTSTKSQALRSAGTSRSVRA